MLQGTYVALITPFKNGSIDWTALENLIQFHLDNGTTGIVLLGTTAETSALASDEKDALLRFALKKIAGKLPVIIGTGTNNLHQTLASTQKAKELGADYALIITPYYIKPTQKGMLEYFGTIASKVDIPIIIYNVPGRTGVNMSAATTVELARNYPNIAGLKDASANLVQTTQIIRDAPEDFFVLSGEDALNFPIIAIGGKGTISVTANVAPRLVSEHIATCLKGDLNTAAKQHQYLAHLNEMMFIETNPIPAKEALAMMGKINIEFRSPMCPLLDNNRALLKQCLQDYKLI
ncbi:MAG: 4-hydroxy-tetrahydrodipicolinate synthase [Candidatus Cloacimonas sp.]